VVAPGPIAGADVHIEPDLSNAGPFLAAALLAGGRVTIAGWPESTTQVGDLFATLLPRFGATVSRDAGGLTVDGGAGWLGGDTWEGVDLDLTEGGELAPTFAALAALATTASRITGIGHLRGHETDRLAALVTEITGLGGRVSELDDGLAFEPAPLHGGPWRAYADHRIATTGALLGLVIPGIVVDDIGTTAKTLPEFPALWEQLRA
jgi:3-phosphoshikimate 1-carboxyvinyltransferase